MPDCLAAALDMARRGFRVFPCVPYGKRPAFDGWVEAATTDDAQIRAWFADRPDYNYGVLTTDRVVADVDISKIGQEALDNFAKLGGHWETFVVQSPTGGYHAYYEGPDSGLRVAIVPGVDIRSHNGYVVGPGSYTDPARTSDPSVKAAGYYTVLVEEAIAWCPPELEVLLRPPGKRAERVNFSVELDTPTAISNAQAWLSTAPVAIEGQGGDNQTYQVAAKLVRDFALSAQVAYELMLPWNDRCVPPWQLDMLLAKIENAEEYGTGALGQARPEATFGTVTVPAMPLQVFEHQANELGIFLGNALAALDLKARPWLAERLLMRGDVTVLAATGAGGKSIAKLTIAAHFAVGQDFGPYKLKTPGKPQRIFIYNAEDDIAEQTRRLLAVCSFYKLDYEAVRANIILMDDRHGDLIVATAERNVAHEDLKTTAFVIETLITNNIDIAMFDPMVNVHQCNENDPGQMRFVVQVFRKIARQTNAAVILAHHTNKGAVNADKGSAESIRGSGAIINSARMAILLSGPEDSDLSQLGIDKTQRHSYVRWDDAKANLFLRVGKPIMWTRWQTVKIATGDLIGVPDMLQVDAAKQTATRRIAETIHREMVILGTATCTVADAVRMMKAEDEMYRAMCISNDVALRRLIQNTLVTPVELGDGEQLIYASDKIGHPIIKII